MMRPQVAPAHAGATEGEGRWAEQAAMRHSDERPQQAATPARDPDRMAVWSLLYLGFLFVNWEQAPLSRWLAPTLVTLALFVAGYLYALRHVRGHRLLWFANLFALLGYVLLPYNVSANTYLIYAAALVPLSGLAVPRALGWIFASIALLGLESMWLGWPLRFQLMVMAITVILATAVYAANYFERERNMRQAELKLSNDEVRRLGGLAERERISRDLHDLLGHTLSLIAIKSELAARLLDRDPIAARRELADVERVARDALGQVRQAVSGIRAAGLGAELAAARLLLESADVRLDYQLGDVALPAPVETVLALVVREAVTNIQRHARASHAHIVLEQHDDEARLLIEDDGRGGVIEPGNGLAGMRERLAACGGRLEIDSVRAAGTRLRISVPLSPASNGAARGDLLPGGAAHA